MADRKVWLSTLWIFLIANYLYCDVLSHMEPKLLKELIGTGELGGLRITEGLLLGSAILMEIPILMILLSRILKRRPNRWANMIAGTIMAIVQTATLPLGADITMHYMFYTLIEVAASLLVVGLAWTWREPKAV